MRLLPRFPAWILVCTLVLACALTQADELTGPERDVAKLFDTWCLEQDLDLKAIDRRATAAHYEVAMDRRIPLANGEEFIQKNWVLPYRDGAAPVLLSTNQVANGSRQVLGCSIYGPDLNGQVMEAELSKLQRMGMPTKHPPQLPDGGRTVWWAACVGSRAASEDSEVMMSRDVPSMPGVSINLIYKLQEDDRG